LILAIDEYVDRHNQKPKPFIWTASANDILEKSETSPESPRQYSLRGYQERGGHWTLCGPHLDLTRALAH
jgi:hypothetical protein